MSVVRTKVHGNNPRPANRRLHGSAATWLLDLAAVHGLHAMVGLPRERHGALHTDRGPARDIERRVRACAGHPAVRCIAIGNRSRRPSSAGTAILAGAT
jgi:hypothetical protein